MLVRKDEQGKMLTDSVLGVAFVPLVNGERVSQH